MPPSVPSRQVPSPFSYTYLPRPVTSNTSSPLVIAQQMSTSSPAGGHSFFPSFQLALRSAHRAPSMNGLANSGKLSFSEPQAASWQYLFAASLIFNCLAKSIIFLFIKTVNHLCRPRRGLRGWRCTYCLRASAGRTSPLRGCSRLPVPNRCPSSALSAHAEPRS